MYANTRLRLKMQKVVFLCLFFTIVYHAAFTVGFDNTRILRQSQIANDEECRTLMPDSKKNLSSCCQMPNILPGLDNSWENCFEKFKQFKDKPTTKEYKEMVHGDEPPCLFQCIFMQSGLANGDGTLNKENINRKMIEGMNNDQKWKSLWQPTLNKCFDEVQNEDKKPIPIIMNTPAGRLMKCFLRDLYMNCPKDIWVESSECTDTRNLVKKCPDLPPPVFKPLPKLI